MRAKRLLYKANVISPQPKTKYIWMKKSAATESVHTICTHCTHTHKRHMKGGMPNISQDRTKAYDHLAKKKKNNQKSEKEYKKR